MSKGLSKFKPGDLVEHAELGLALYMYWDGYYHRIMLFDKKLSCFSAFFGAWDFNIKLVSSVSKEAHNVL